METGLEKIALKRAKQLEKGFTIDHDIQHEPGDSLLKAEVATIEGDFYKFPEHWTDDDRKRILNHGKTDKVAIAGALLAAYIDKEYKSLKDFYTHHDY